MYAPRSYLYAPAHNERILAKVLDRGADAVILDLEDGVPSDAKDTARDNVRSFLHDVAADTVGPIVLVRVNRDGEGWDQRDIEAADHPACSSVMLPKAEDPERVAQVASSLYSGGRNLHLLIESARGVSVVDELARCPRVGRLGFGAADLAWELGCATDARHPAFDHIRGRLVVASAAAGISPPVDPVHLDVDDLDGLRDGALRAREFGFAGKTVVHPKQVAIVNEAFSPTAADLAWATRIATAAKDVEGDGAILVDGHLVDEPVLRRAEAIIDLADRLGQEAEA